MQLFCNKLDFCCLVENFFLACLFSEWRLAFDVCPSHKAIWLQKTLMIYIYVEMYVYLHTFFIFTSIFIFIFWQIQSAFNFIVMKRFPQCSPKINLLLSTKEKPCQFGMTRGWINDDNIILCLNWPLTFAQQSFVLSNFNLCIGWDYLHLWNI